jgi:hypothetical protein
MTIDTLKYRTSGIHTAASLCKLGIQVFPAEFAQKSPGRGVFWKDIATNDINLFVRQVPSGLFNLAMVFSPQSGVMDIEPDDDEAAALIEALMAENGVRTLSYRSRRGIHRIFRWEQRFAHWNNANPKAGKLDIRMGTADKAAYSICPPSVHPETKEHYLWLPGCAPWEIAPAAVPENVIRYVLENANARETKQRVLEVDAADDGYLPSPGARHDYLLGFSKLLHNHLLLPKETCLEHVRLLSQQIGTYDEPGRGETEVVNCFRGLTRPIDPVKQMSAHISMAVVNEVVEDTFSRYEATNRGPKDEIPSHIFPPMIEKASQAARASQYPRNLWLMSVLAAVSAARGTSLNVRSSPFSPTTGVQLYSFGVGGSGSGKSKVLKAILEPFAKSETVVTDATPEALTSSMARFPRGVLLELSEGKDFYKMLGRYGQTPGVSSDNSLFHKCWSGDRIRVQRQKGSLWLENPFLTVCGAIQRLNLMQMPQNDCVDGLLQRMVLAPVGETPKRADPAAMKEHRLFLNEWHHILGRLMSAKITVGHTSLTDLVSGAGKLILPTTHTLNTDAQKIWDDYAAMKKSAIVEAQWADPDHPFRSDIVRHAELVLRLASLLKTLWDACDAGYWNQYNVGEMDHDWIPPMLIRNAIDLMEFLWHHKLLLVENLVETAYTAASKNYGLNKSEGVQTRVDKYAEERKVRVERQVGTEWMLRDYYRVFGLKKIEAQREVDLFMREGRVVMHDLKPGEKAIRFSFKDE